MANPNADLATPLNLWIAEGKAISARRLELEWLQADWLAQGKAAGHLCCVKFDFLGESLGLPTRRLKDALKAATNFPPTRRNPSLSVEHHATIASLPADEAADLLERAAAERLPIRAMREAVTQHRYATGERWDDEDADSTLATLQIRAWNRATPEARAMAFEQFKIAAAKGLAVVDEDEATEA